MSLRRNRDFVCLWAGQAVSLLGDRLHYLALVALVASTHEGLTGPLASSRLSVIALSTTLPVVLFAGVAGSLVDRWRKRTVLIACDSLRAGLVLLVPLSQSLGGGLPAALGIIFVIYTVNVFFLPARAAILPELVPPEHLVRANAATTSGNIVATIVGTAAGGAIIQSAGYAWGFYLDAVSYALSVFAMSSIRPAAALPTAPRVAANLGAILADIAGGMRTLRHHPAAACAVALFGVLYVAGASLFVLAPPAVARITTAPTRATGFLIAALASGAIIGSAIVARLGSRRHEWRTSAGGMVVAGGALAALALAHTVTALAVTAAVAGLGAAPLLISADTILQRDVPRAVRARVFAARDVIVKTAFLLTAGGVGALAAHVRAADILFAEGGFLFLGGAILFARGRTLAVAHVVSEDGEPVGSGVARHVPEVDERAADGAVVVMNRGDHVVEGPLGNRAREGQPPEDLP